MIPRYFDTNALVYAAQARKQVSGWDERLQKYGDLVVSMLDAEEEGFISELTVWEFENTIAKIARRTEFDVRSFDAEWMAEQMGRLMRLILNGGLTVVPTHPRTLEHASALVRRGAESGRALFLWDSAHVITAAKLSREHGEKVSLVTADDDFSTILEVFSGFRNFIEICDLRALS